MTTLTQLEREMEINGTVYNLFAELDVNVSTHSEGYEHFGNCGSRAESETQVEVTGFSILTSDGVEIWDKEIRRAASAKLDDVVHNEAEEIAERAGAYED